MKLFHYDRKIMKTVTDMAWPAIVESFFVAFAGLVDSYMVSTMGATAVAAIGLTTQPKFIGMSPFFAFNVAVAAIVARRRGEKRRDDANSVVLTGLIFVAAASFLLGAVIAWQAPAIMTFCGAKPETLGPSVLYFRIIMGGMFFNCILGGVNAAQRGAGNTKITMRTNMTSNIVNIIFNYLLIGGHFGFPAWGIRGAAIATVFGTVVGCVMSIFSLMKPDGFISLPYLFSHHIKPGFNAMKQLVNVGYSVFFEQVLTRIGFAMTALMAADKGTYAIAAHQVGMNILGLTFAFGDGLSAACVALIGRSLGERNIPLAKEYGRTGRFVGGCISAVLAVIYLFGGKPLYKLFFQEPEIISIGTGIMFQCAFIVLFQLLQVTLMGCLRGAGDTRFTAIVSMISIVFVRTATSYVCGYVLGWGILGIWLGILVDQATRYGCAVVRFRKEKWTQIKI